MDNLKVIRNLLLIATVTAALTVALGVCGVINLLEAL